MHLRPPAVSVTQPHASTVCLATKRSRPRTPGLAAAQLAWLTDDMLKPSTRTGGIAARLK
jgi:hypothetical protein